MSAARKFFEPVNCSVCVGKEGCDCYVCHGRGVVPSPLALEVSRYIGDKVKAIRDADDTERDPDVSELLRVLDRIVRGRDITSAFGAPGDWGHEHPVGAALSRAFRTPQPVAS